MKLSKKIKPSKKGFTLVELLVVIAIIATLGGLAFGPILKHLEGADVTKAKKVCKDLTFAITGFEQDYDSLPYTGSSYPTTDTLYTTASAGFLDVLMGKDDEVNYKIKEYFTARRAVEDKDGLVYTGSIVTRLVDKWGNPYHILLNFNTNDGLKPANVGPGATGESYTNELFSIDAISASPGPDRKFNDSQDAKSW